MQPQQLEKETRKAKILEFMRRQQCTMKSGEIAAMLQVSVKVAKEYIVELSKAGKVCVLRFGAYSVVVLPEYAEQVRQEMRQRFDSNARQKQLERLAEKKRKRRESLKWAGKCSRKFTSDQEQEWTPPVQYPSIWAYAAAQA